MNDSFGRPLAVDGAYPNGRLACASVIETAIATTDTDAFFAAFKANRFWGGSWSSKVDAMSRDVRMLTMTDWLLYTRKDCKSLARHKWFAAFGPDFERWLLELKAVNTARYVKEQLDLYPDGIPFKAEVERDRHMKVVEAANPHVWELLRTTYPSLEDELAVRLREFLQKRGRAIGEECEALRTRFGEPLPPALREIVEAPSTDAEFSAALIDWLNAPKGRPGLGFEKQPEMGRMLWVLNALSTSLFVGGMAHFLHSVGVGRYFPKLAMWAKTIGATTTAEYATAASKELKRLNGGKLPPMADDKRIATVHELELQDQAAGGRGLMDPLDQEYRVLVRAEIPRKLRAYVRDHLDEIETEGLGVLRL